MGVLIFLRSFTASNILKTSMPFFLASLMKFLTISSGWFL